MYLTEFGRQDDRLCRRPVRFSGDEQGIRDVFPGKPAGARDHPGGEGAGRSAGGDRGRGTASLEMIGGFSDFRPDFVDPLRARRWTGRTAPLVLG